MNVQHTYTYIATEISAIQHTIGAARSGSPQLMPHFIQMFTDLHKIFMDIEMDFQPLKFSPAIIKVHTLYFTHTLSLRARIVLPRENQII